MSVWPPSGRHGGPAVWTAHPTGPPLKAPQSLRRAVCPPRPAQQDPSPGWTARRRGRGRERERRGGGRRQGEGHGGEGEGAGQPGRCIRSGPVPSLPVEGVEHREVSGLPVLVERVLCPGAVQCQQRLVQVPHRQQTGHHVL